MYNPSGAEQTVTLADGRALVLGRLTVKVLRSWKEWVAQQVGDPFADVERWLGKAPDVEVARLLREAEGLRDQLRYFSLATPLAQRFLATEEGLAKLFRLLLLERQPQASDEDGLAVALHLSSSEDGLGKALRRAQGLPEVGAGGGEGSAPAPAEGGEGNAGRPPL